MDVSAAPETPASYFKGFVGKEPERILGCADTKKERIFLMQWKGQNDADLVPAKEAYVVCPQLAIRFYEDKIIVKDRRRSDSSSSPDIGNRSGAGPSKKRKMTKAKGKTRGKGKQKKKAAKNVHECVGEYDEKVPNRIEDFYSAFGDIIYEIGWRGTSRTDTVPAKIANVMWPQLVLEFLADQFFWRPPTN